MTFIKAFILATMIIPSLGKRLLFLGTPDVAALSLRTLLLSSHEIAAVVTQPPAPAGRNKKITPSPVQLLAEERGIKVLCPASAKDPAFLEAVEALAPDLCVTVRYSQPCLDRLCLIHLLVW